MERMIAEVISSRELIWRLFWRDFLARYRQSALGVAWIILQPLFLVGLFVAMNQAGIFQTTGLDLPYVPYALAGLALWQIFSGGVSSCSLALIEAGHLIAKINLPRSALVFAAFGQATAEFLVRLAITAMACLWYGLIPDGFSFILAAMATLPLCLLALGSGFVLAIAAALFRDVINATTMALSGLLLLTPVLYPLKADSLLAKLNALNPLNYLINVPRDLALHGHSTDLSAYAISVGFALLVFLMGWRLFFIAQPHISERI
jgi:lipopolysaccharide transport system permease protein